MKLDSIDQQNFNALATHPLQAYEWGEFREKTGIKVIRQILERENISVQMTIHKIPHTPWTIGYFPKGVAPTEEMLEELKKIGKDNNCVFIQMEPNVVHSSSFTVHRSDLVPAARPLFTKYTFILDLTKTEEELLKNVHSKTRYNIRVAEKHGVTVTEDNSDEAFADYLRLTKETTDRQGFYAHTQSYHRLMWDTLKVHSSQFTAHSSYDELTAHLLLAKYQGQTLTSWIVFVFKETLYYPYGASSSEHRETMASNLMMWEAIKFGKKLGLKKFDMWGALGPDPDTRDPWYGFHRFKEGYGPTLTEFVGSYDLVINPLLYQIYKASDKLRWFYLRMKK